MTAPDTLFKEVFRRLVDLETSPTAGTSTTYDGTGSGLTAADLQAAIDEIAALIGGGVGGTFQRTLARWGFTGWVVPLLTTQEKMPSAGQLEEFDATVLVAPAAGNQILFDAFLNGASLWANPADRPVIASGLYEVALPLAAPIAYAKGDKVWSQVVNPAGRDVEIMLMGK